MRDSYFATTDKVARKDAELDRKDVELARKDAEVVLYKVGRLE